MVRISVVIPTLNEDRWIEDTLDSVSRQPGPKEIIVVDGGSTDLTRECARESARVFRAARGRAVQMNTGAARASGDILLFLHADTLLPTDAFAAMRRAFANPRTEAGAFRLQFNRSSPLLRFYSWCTKLRIPQICFGDRGLFVRRTVFDQIGGYPELPIFEDLELVRHLYDRGGFVFARPAVTTAARRFIRTGPFIQQLRNSCLWIYYMTGGDLHRAARFYTYGGAPGVRD